MQHLLIDRLILLIPFLLSLSVHEWAHAWTALKLGDDTAERQSRVSLNPFVHIDPVGTLLLPLLGVPFGWAKPVPFLALRFHSGISMRFGAMLIAAAGPISNFILAAISVAIIRMRAMPGNLFGAQLQLLLNNLVAVNVCLGVFNLIPVPPLDGSWVIAALLPGRLHKIWVRLISSSLVSITLLILVIMYAWPSMSRVMTLVQSVIGSY